MRTFRAALWLIRDVSVPSLREHRLRSVLTLVGVTIGAQIVVAIVILNRSITASFADTVARIAGPADLQVANAMAGVPETLAERLANEPGVASAAGLVHGTLATAYGELTVFGVDLLRDQQLRESQFPRRHVHLGDELRFVNATDSVALSASFAARAGLTVGTSIDVYGPTGTTTLMMRGTLDPVGPAALFGGNVALVDLPTAQRLFERHGRFDQIDVGLADHVDPVEILPRLRSIVGGVGTVESPREHGSRMGSMLASVQTVLTLVSLLAVVVGAFIVHATMGTAVAHRRRALTLARALGYERRAVRLAIVLEASVYGLTGTVLGVALGVASATLSLRLAALGVGAIWGRTDVTALAVRPTDFVSAVGIGIGGAVISSMVAAGRAASFHILDELREGAGTKDTSPWGDAAVGMLVLGLGATILASELRGPTDGATIALIFGAIMACAGGLTRVGPLLLAGVARAARPLAARARPAPPALAVESILRDPTRSRSAIAAVMVAFALVLIVGAFVRSLRGSILSWVDQTLAADFFVSPTMQLPLPSGPTFDAPVEQALREIPGIATIGAARMINVRIGDALAVLRTEGAEDFGRKRYPVADGDLSAETMAAFTSGSTVFVSDNFAYRRGVRAGEQLVLDTPAGERRFRIGAILTDYTLDVGTIIIDRAVYRQTWNDPLVNTFGIWLEPGVDAAEVRRAIANRLQPRYHAAVLSGAEFNAQIAGALDAALGLTNAMQLVAVVIAFIGIVNFFLAEVVNRRREIGLLRGVALTRGQIVQWFSVEACLLGLSGGILATAFGWIVARLLVLHSTRLISGWSLSFDYPWASAMAVIVLSSVSAIGASIPPARHAASEPIGELVITG